jgi:hypothetical protein
MLRGSGLLAALVQTRDLTGRLPNLYGVRGVEALAHSTAEMSSGNR